MKKYNKIWDFYIEEGEEYLIKYLVPEYYIYSSLSKKSLTVGYALRFLQNELNELLHSFVNGGFSYKGYLLFPLSKEISESNIKKISRLKEIAVFLNENGYDFSGSVRGNGRIVNSKNFALALSALYDDFSRIKNKNTKIVKKPKCKELDLNNYKKADSGYLSPLKELKNYANDRLKQFLKGFYLHGSLATKDYIKWWSDVDTLAIVSKETIDDPKSLLELRDNMYRTRYFLYRIDPLQHHGSIVISEYDIENYCQAYFPPPIFNYAKSFFGDDKLIEFRARDCSKEAISKLFWFVNYFRKLNIEKRVSMGGYKTKNFLHSITLFPSMYLQAKGILVYKKFSFELAKKDFRKESWNVIDNASSIRLNWRNSGTMPLIDVYSRANPLLYYQLNSRVVDLFKNTAKINNINTKQLIESMFKLSEEAWSKVKENVRSKKL